MLVTFCLGPEPTTPVTPQPSSLSASKRESARVYHNLVSDCLCMMGFLTLPDCCCLYYCKYSRLVHTSNANANASASKHTCELPQCKCKRKRKRKCQHKEWTTFHFLALAFALAFAFHTCEPGQRKRKAR